MKGVCILILFLFFATNSLEKAKSVKVKLEETQLKTFDEIFGEGCWDKDEAEDFKKPAPNFGQNAYHHIDRQNTQLRQIEPNSTDQNLPLTESDHSDNAKNVEQNKVMKVINSNKNMGQTSMAHKRQLPIVLDAHTSVSVEDEHDSLKMISPLSKSARRTRTRSKTPQNKSFEEDNCSEESEEANHSREKIEESDYSESEEFEGIDQQNLRKRIQYTEEEKLEIVNKFLKMKQNLYNSGDKRPYKEINKEIADKLNVPIRTIYLWKKNFGHTIYYSEEEKLEIVNKFLKMKYELYNNKNGKRSYREINKKIAVKLNVSIRTLYKWKKNFGHRIFYSEEEKLEIVNKFLQMKQELCNKGDKKLGKEIDKEIADKFGVTIGTIYKWIKKLGFSTLKRFTSEEKIEIVKRFEKLKKENPKLKKKEIAKKLQISCTYLNQLIKQIPR